MTQLRRVRGARAGAVAAALAGLLVGCGTTVSVESRAQLSTNGSGLAQAGGGLGTTPAAGTPLPGSVGGSTGSVGSVGGAPGSGTGGAVVTPGATGPTGGPGSPGGPAVSSSIPVKGPGWDKDFVYIGVTTQKDVNAVAQSVGANGLDAGDQEGQAKAVVDAMNRQGGVFGRKIKLVFKDQSTVATKNDPNTEGNTACTYFTQDHPVIALLNPVTLMDVPSFRSCLAKAKVPLFSASVAAVDAKVGASLAPYFYQSVAPTWDALAPVLVRSLQQQGWFGGWNPVTGSPASTKAKVGLLVPSDDVAKRVGQIITRTLNAAGSTDVVVYEHAEGSDMSSAVVNFNGNGVTHVIASNADLFPFQLAASSQRYRPRYGVTSLNAPVTFLETNSPDEQNVGALGVGWSPSLDVSDANDPGATNPGEKECADLLRRGGQTFSGKRLAEAVAFAFCDGIRLIVQSAVAGGGLTGQHMYQGVQRIAGSFRTAFSFASGLGPNRLFMPGAVRPLAYVTSCNCFRYASRTSTRL